MTVTVSKACKRSYEEYITIEVILKVPIQIIHALKYNYRRDFRPTVVDYSYYYYKFSIIWISIIYSFVVEGDVDLITSSYSNLKAAFIEIRYIIVLHTVLLLTLIELYKIPLNVVYNIYS